MLLNFRNNHNKKILVGWTTRNGEKKGMVLAPSLNVQVESFYSLILLKRLSTKKLLGENVQSIFFFLSEN